MDTLEALYEDDYLLIIHKPPRLHSVIHPKRDNPSIARMLLQRDPSSASISEKRKTPAW